MADQCKEPWHLSKSINVSHILSTLVITVSVITWIGGIQSDQEKLRLELAHIKDEQNAMARRTNLKFGELKTDLKDISRKLDRLIEAR